MSKASKGKVHLKIKETTNRDETTDAEDKDNSEEKKKLLSDIKALETLIFQTEMSLGIATFGDIRKESIPSVEETSKGRYNKLVDVEALLQNELYSYAGLACKRTGEDVIFAFQSLGKGKKGLWSDKNCIQMLKVDDQWTLGKWVMPMGVDIKTVFAKYSIGSAASMKLFLRECKHLLDCYHRRQREFTELEAFLKSLGRNCGYVDTNYGYTQITITMVKGRPASPDEAREIVIFLAYKTNEARPYKVLIDCDGENRLPDDEKTSLKALFKSIKDEDLKDVVEKVLMSDESPFVSTQASDDNSMIDTTNSEEEEEESDLMKTLKKSKKPKTAKKRGKVAVETDENENEVNSDDERSLNDFSIDVADRTNAESGEEGKKGTKKSKKSPAKKSLQKTEAHPKVKQKSKTSGPSRKENSPLKHRSVFDTRNDRGGESSKNDKATKTIVPEMFKPKAGKSKGVSEVNKEALTPPKKSTKSNEIGIRGGKTPRNVENFAGPSASHPHGPLVCSTPIVGRNVNFSTVAAKNISAIRRENTIIEKDITKKNFEVSSASDHSDESDSNESDGNATKVAESQKELLKDLQAVKNKVTAAKKPVKRSAKSPAQRKTKKARK